MKRTITSEELKALLDTHNEVTVLDVRRKADYDADPETAPVPGGATRTKADAWSADLPKDKNVVIYCARGGSVSNKMLDRLLEKKIQARYLEGGSGAPSGRSRRLPE